MTDIIERTDEPILIKEGTVEKPRADAPKLTLRATYTPPLDGSSPDLQQYDTFVALRIAETLTENYYGYDWKVFADSLQGVVGFSIPSLMGPTLHYVIRLAEWNHLDKRMIVQKAGELLERMNLPRSRVDIAAYYEAMTRRHTFDFSSKNKVA